MIKEFGIVAILSLSATLSMLKRPQFSKLKAFKLLSANAVQPTSYEHLLIKFYRFVSY
jgi:hypothetical protein